MDRIEQRYGFLNRRRTVDGWYRRGEWRQLRTPWLGVGPWQPQQWRLYMRHPVRERRRGELLRSEVVLYCSTEGASPPPPVPPPRPPSPPSPPTSPPPPPGFYVRIFENTAYVDTSGESANMKSALSAASDVIVSSFTSMTDSSQWSSSTVVLPEFERGVPSLDMTVATAARNFVSSGGVYIIACTPLHISRVDHVVRPALPFGPCSSSATLIDRHSCALCPLSPPEQMHLGRRVLSTPSFRSPCPRAATALQQRRQAAGRA
jgi:hypothetical protein